MSDIILKIFIKMDIVERIVMKSSDKQIIIKSFLFGLVSFLIVQIIFFFNGMEPWGNGACITDDMDIQYLDFFSYLLNVIHGKDSILYTIHNGLGGSGFGVFSYYLASPFNILLFFFDQAQLPLFVDVVISLKIGLCTMTFSIFAMNRMPKVRTYWVFVLSICYGLMQYNIAQSFNIMWLDGVYMLPLVALGIYKLVWDKKIGFFSLVTGLTIIFNWYIGGVICVFTLFWLVVEYFMKIISLNQKIDIIDILQIVLKYAVSMINSVFISAVIFLPSIFELQKGRGKSFDWQMLKNEFLWSPFNLLKSTFITSTSSQFEASLFCGSVVVVLMLFYFFAVKRDWLKKVMMLLVLVVAGMSLCYRPLFFLFSLFKEASSYYYRYSFLVIFCMIFIALLGAEKVNDEVNHIAFIISVGVCILGEIFAWNLSKTMDIKWMIITLVMEVIFMLLIVIMGKTNGKVQLVVNVVLIIAMLLEIGVNTKELFDIYYINWDSEAYRTYVKEQEEQLINIKGREGRIHQTLNRRRDEGGVPGLSANWNEGLGYGYKSISSYTSCPDAQTTELLNQLGYRSEVDRITITNCPILATDSILGVKYLLSDYDVRGYEKRDEHKLNGKCVYENPFALPMAFTIDNVVEDICAENTFQWTNMFLRQFSKKDLDVYKKKECSIENISGREKVYNVSCDGEKEVLYGDLVWNDEFYTYEFLGGTTVNVNEEYEIAYAQWLSQSVFYIPTENGTRNSKVHIKSGRELGLKDELFYALDLNSLKEVTSEIQKNEISMNIDGNEMSTTVVSDEPTNLMVLIPYDESWKLQVNGENANIKRCGGDFMSIPIGIGENEIELTYEPKGLRLGMLLTMVAVLALIVMFYMENKRNKGGA
ncbi:MAG: YfhO family protein [Lachnospiraceae bacterium]|nr:YfhO family protein [Lachnospiraceae bacterium]